MTRRLAGAAAGRRAHLLGVEPGDEAIRLGDLPAARRRTVVVRGHESDGAPPDALELLHRVVEMPMLGTGTSLDVAVSGTLVAYRLAALLQSRGPEVRGKVDRTHHGDRRRGTAGVPPGAFPVPERRS